MKKVFIVVLFIVVIFGLVSCLKDDNSLKHKIEVVSGEGANVTINSDEAKSGEKVYFNVEIDSNILEYSLNLLYSNQSFVIKLDSSYFIMPNSDVVFKCDVYEKQFVVNHNIEGYTPKKAPLPVQIYNPDPDNLLVSSLQEYENEIELFSFEHITTNIDSFKWEGIYTSYEDFVSTKIGFDLPKELFDFYFIYINVTLARTDGFFPTYLSSAFVDNRLILNTQYIVLGENVNFINSKYEVAGFIFEKQEGLSPIQIEHRSVMSHFLVKGTIALLYFKGYNFEYYSYLLEKYPSLNLYNFVYQDNYINIKVSDSLLVKEDFEVLFEELLNEEKFIYYILQSEVDNYYYVSLDNNPDIVSLKWFFLDDNISTVIDNYSDFLSFVDSFPEYANNYLESLSKYDETFFLNNNLYIFDIIESSGSISHQNFKVEYRETETIISFITLVPSLLTMDMSSNIFFVPITKTSSTNIKLTSFYLNINFQSPSSLYYYDNYVKNNNGGIPFIIFD